MRNLVAGAIGGLVAGAALSGVMLAGRRAGLLHRTLAEHSEDWLDRNFAKAGVDYEIRETFESALAFGGAGLRTLGMTALDVSEVTEDVRRRDGERLDVQAQEGLLAGGEKLHVEPRPEPLVPPRNRPAETQA